MGDLKPDAHDMVEILRRDCAEARKCGEYELAEHLYIAAEMIEEGIVDEAVEEKDRG